MTRRSSRRDVSHLQERRCAWCRADLPPHARADSKYCSKTCRQTAFRLRKRAVVVHAQGRPMRVAYADPPYPGTAKKYYGDQPTYAGEVDHEALVASLVDEYDGWALSTSAAAVRALLPLCPEGVRLCPWVKPHGPSPRTWGIHNCWEAVIVSPARHLRPGVRDWLSAHAARGGGTLPGRKPIAFCAWLFQLLGMQPGDELVDLFPGTGVVSRAWREVSLAPASATPGDDASPEYSRHES